MHTPVEDLRHLCSSEDSEHKIPQNAQAYSVVCAIASSLIAIVKNPSCSFEKRKCTLFNFVESFKTYISSSAPYRISLTMDTNGFEYFVFIATLGVYSIDIVLYKDVCGWVMLTDGSCVRTPVEKCEDDTVYTVSVRKSSCVPPNSCTVDCGDCLLVYSYDACNDSCNITTYCVSQAQVKITSIENDSKAFVYFDISVGSKWLQHDFELRYLPCGLAVKAYQDENEIGATSCFYPLCAEKKTNVKLALVDDCGKIVSEDEQQIVF